MKITGIKVRQVEVPLVEPFRISLGVITHSRSVIVSVETDEGLVGYGEGAPAILITGESLSGTSDVIREMERDLIGVDPTDLEKVYWIMDRAAAHSGSAKNAIDMACYDLLGKKAGMPVYKLLGGQVEALEFLATGPSDRLLHIPLKDLDLRSGVLLAAIVREGVTIIPGGLTTIEEGDHVLVIAQSMGLNDLTDILA